MSDETRRDDVRTVLREAVEAPALALIDTALVAVHTVASVAEPPTRPRAVRDALVSRADPTTVMLVAPVAAALTSTGELGATMSLLTARVRVSIQS